MSIMGNFVGSYSQMGKTFVIEDENGNELTGVITKQEVIFDATDNDVREGMTYASDSGISTGTKFIPPYYVRYGYKTVFAGKNATIVAPEYDYESLLITIATYNTSWSQSTVLTYVSVDNAVYSMEDNSKVSDIVIDHDNATINLGITVNEKSILRYFVVMEDA